MFHWLYELFFEHFSPLRVFSYPSFRIVAATATSLCITMLLYPWFIEKLQRKKVGEKIREDGPETHAKKAGTPTMGGILVLIALVVCLSQLAGCRDVRACVSRRRRLCLSTSQGGGAFRG